MSVSMRMCEYKYKTTATSATQQVKSLDTPCFSWVAAAEISATRTATCCYPNTYSERKKDGDANDLIPT